MTQEKFTPTAKLIVENDGFGGLVITKPGALSAICSFTDADEDRPYAEFFAASPNMYEALKCV